MHPMTRTPSAKARNLQTIAIGVTNRLTKMFNTMLASIPLPHTTPVASLCSNDRQVVDVVVFQHMSPSPCVCLSMTCRLRQALAYGIKVRIHILIDVQKLIINRNVDHFSASCLLFQLSKATATRSTSISMVPGAANVGLGVTTSE